MKIRGSILGFVVVVTVLIALLFLFGKKSVGTLPTVSVKTSVVQSATTGQNVLANHPAWPDWEPAVNTTVIVPQPAVAIRSGQAIKSVEVEGLKFDLHPRHHPLTPGRGQPTPENWRVEMR